MGKYNLIWSGLTRDYGFDVVVSCGQTQPGR